MLVVNDLALANFMQWLRDRQAVLAEELVFARRTVVERQLITHDDLIQIEGHTFRVNHERLLELCWLGDNDIALPDYDHFVHILVAILYHLSSEVLSV